MNKIKSNKKMTEVAFLAQELEVFLSAIHPRSRNDANNKGTHIILVLEFL